MGGRLMPDRRDPRTARLNRLLREIIATELERLSGLDDELPLLTVTHVEVESDLRHATVLFATMDTAVEEALGELRPHLQAAIARQVRMKRTPLLSFAADPAVSSGQRVEEILRHLEKDMRTNDDDT
jgi:ribosome-binding factor A